MSNFFKSTYTCFLVSGVLAALAVLFNDGRGATDLIPFLVWTFAFGVTVGFIKESVRDRLLRFPTAARYVVALAAGVLLGTTWTYILYAYYGHWAGAFSFPILPCWVAAGASGMLINLSPHNTVRQFRFLELTCIAILSLSILALGKPLSTFMTGDQSVEVVSLKWLPGPQPLTLRDSDVERLGGRPGLLQDTGISGALTFSASSGEVGRGKPARAVIIMYRQLNEPVSLPQPDGTEIIYVQREDGWSKYPADAPVSDRKINLWADPGDSNRTTRYSVERADGSHQGGTLFIW